MSELEWAAVGLAGGVLLLIGVISLFLLYAAHHGEYSAVPAEVDTVHKLLAHQVAQAASAATPEALERTTQLLRQLHESRQGARKVWFDFAQLLLLNMLLPVLTAILGYVFGTLKSGTRNSGGDG